MITRPSSMMTSLFAWAAVLVLGMSTPARADLEIKTSTNGSTWTEVGHDTSGGTATFTGTSGGLKFQALGTISDSPGEGSTSNLIGFTGKVTNSTSSTKTVYVTLGDTGYTTPTAPPGFIQVNSNVSGTVLTKSANNALVFQSYIDPANGQNSLTGVTPGPQTPGITGTPTTSFNNTAYATISHLTGPYSITEYFKITLGGGSSFNFSSSTTLTLVPEPSSMAIAGLSMLGMIGCGVCRRRSA